MKKTSSKGKFEVKRFRRRSEVPGRDEKRKKRGKTVSVRMRQKRTHAALFFASGQT